VFLGSFANMAAKGYCQSPCAITTSAFLLVIAAWNCTAEDEVCLLHIDTQEGRFRSVHSKILLAHLQFIGAVENPGVTCDH